MKYVIVDVGCIECGEQTEVRGLFDTLEEAKEELDKLCDKLGIEKYEPRGGFLEFLGLYGHKETTYLGGTGYFTKGQRALELHQFPPRQIEENNGG